MAHDAHDSHASAGHDAHGHHDAPQTPQPPPPHVFTIARVTRWIGIAMCAVFLLGVAYYELLRSPVPCARVGLSAFLSLYGFCIWRAASDTLAREAETTTHAHA